MLHMSIMRDAGCSVTTRVPCIEVQDQQLRADIYLPQMQVDGCRGLCIDASRVHDFHGNASNPSLNGTLGLGASHCAIHCYPHSAFLLLFPCAVLGPFLSSALSVFLGRFLFVLPPVWVLLPFSADFCLLWTALSRGGSLPPPGGLGCLRAFSLPSLVCWGGGVSCVADRAELGR